MVISFQFFGLLLVTAVIYWLIPVQKYRSYLLSISSLLFIGFYDKSALIVVSCLTVSTYCYGYLIQKKEKKGIYLFFGVTSILLLLIIFKYLGFFERTINDIISFFRFDSNIRTTMIVPPLGISYITFKHISYLTDIKWGIVERGSFGEFLCYSSLFTIFTAGPIERFEKFKPQIQNRISFSSGFIEQSFERITIGLFKKLVIADWIGQYANPVLSHHGNYPTAVVLAALLGFSIQIYMDFSGYSDIAIGASMLFGIKIMENFNYPYFASNISDFWRRWHISLSDWLRDYLFFPLSKVIKKKYWRILIIPVLVMAICGFWHGAEWHFILWGIWHGVGLSIYQLWNNYKRKNKKLAELSRNKWFNAAGIIFTFIFVSLGWWLFI
ncbi:MAG: MBOAT family O-acyltransferase [Ignavibacteria bacterium]